MDGYEKLVDVIKRNIKKEVQQNVFLGEMKTNKTCLKGDLLLDEDDLLIAEHLKTGYYISENVTVSPLKKGDTVILLKISDEKYAIIERVT